MRPLVPTALVLLLLAPLAGCGRVPWNNPYPDHERTANVLYGAFSERPKHLDPARSYSSNEAVFTAQVYEPPLQYHYLKRPYELVPLAAAAIPTARYLDAAGAELPADAAAAAVAETQYEISIQPGIRYAPHPAFARGADGRLRYHALTAADLDGVHALADFAHTGTRELTADDYVYEIKRLANPQLNSPILGLMTEHIVGLADYAKTLTAVIEQRTAAERESYLPLEDYPLAGARALDRYRYEVRIQGKYPQFQYWLAMPFFAPVPPEAERFYRQPGMAARNLTLDWYPVGTGAYMLTVNNPNRQMVLARNPNFRGEPYPAEGSPEQRARGLLADAGKTMPFVDRAVYSLEPETIPYWNKFLQGYYDVSGISSDAFDQAIQFGAGGEAELTEPLREKGIALISEVAASNWYMAFNMQGAVVGGPGEAARKLRQAIAIAVDYEEYIAIFLNGRGIAAQGPIPPGIFGHVGGPSGINPYVYHWHEGRAERRPIADARRLLAEAGYPNGYNAATDKQLTLYFDTAATGPETKSRLDWIRKQFEKLNVQLVIRDTDYNRFQDKMLKGTAQIFEWGWNADYPDPENFLFLLYGPNAKAQQNGENAANYRNPEFDALFEQMKSMDNGPQRQAVIDRMLAIVRADAPWVFGFFPKQFSLHHAWYHNAWPNLMANNTLKYKRVDPVQRATLRAEWNQPVLWPLAVLTLLLALATLPAVVTYLRRLHRPRYAATLPAARP